MSFPSVKSLALAVGLLLIAGYLLVRAVSPKPLPGIPYVAASAKNAFGDIPEAVKYAEETKELFSFLRLKCIELNSPIIQVFMRPFSKPWVVVCDNKESHEILTHRSREFERSDFFKEIFGATTPHNQVLMKTNDTWRAHRRLVADVISPSFLQNVAGPQIHAATSNLIDLWQSKERLSKNHPFDVEGDINETLLDAIFAVAFGPSKGIVESQNAPLKKIDQLDRVPSNADTAVEFPEPAWPETKKAIETVTRSAEISIKSPFGIWAQKFALKFNPSLRNAVKIKEQLLREKLDTAWEKFKHPEAQEEDIQCATDLLVKREVKAAEKAGRKPECDSPAVQDELFGILAAGHDTTATTVQWGMKLLTENPNVQRKLRSSLRAELTRAADEDDMPTAAEIAKAQLPYLEAVIYEILRIGGTSAANIRTATVNTEVLGYQIPQGTDVFMLPTGPSYTGPALPLKESKGGKASNERVDSPWNGNWDVETLGEFLPERWLVKNEKGEMEFNERAGPMQAFGGGIRACFGRKLAKLSMNIIFTLIVWNFELQSLPAELGDMKGMDILTHRPQVTYLRLGKPHVDEMVN